MKLNDFLSLLLPTHKHTPDRRGSAQVLPHPSQDALAPRVSLQQCSAAKGSAPATRPRRLPRLPTPPPRPSDGGARSRALWAAASASLPRMGTFSAAYGAGLAGIERRRSTGCEPQPSDPRIRPGSTVRDRDVNRDYSRARRPSTIAQRLWDRARKIAPRHLRFFPKTESDFAALGRRRAFPLGCTMSVIWGQLGSECLACLRSLPDSDIQLEYSRPAFFPSRTSLPLRFFIRPVPDVVYSGGLSAQSSAV